MKKTISTFFSKILKKKDKKSTDSINQADVDHIRNLDKKLVFNVSKKSKFGIPSFKQFSHISKVLSHKEKQYLAIFSILLIFNIGFLGIQYTFANLTEVPTQGGSYTEGLIGSPQLINPILSQANDVDNDLVSLVYSSLFDYDKNLQLQNDLVDSYSISEDEKTYTISLRQDAYFHDGEQVTADDVLFTVELIKTPDYKSPLYINFDGIYLNRVDDFTIEFTLTESYAPFLHILTFGILPEHIWNNVPPNYFTLAELNIKPIGSGPYKFDALTKDTTGVVHGITLIRHEDYYAQKPYIDELVFKFYPDFYTGIDGLKNKNVQGLSKIPMSAMQDISAEKYTFNNLPLSQYTGIFFNLSKAENLKDLKIRQALAHSVNKLDIITNILNGNAKNTNAPILPGFVGHTDDITTYNYNIGIAQGLIEETDWEKDAETNLLTQDNENLTFTLTTLNQETTLKIAESIAAEWKNLGFDVTVEPLDFNDMKSRIKDRDYEVLLYGELIGADPDPYPFWHSTQRLDPGLNLSMYANKEVDDLIEQARQTTNTEKRAELYKEFSSILTEELPAIFLYTPVYTYVTDKKLQGFDINRIETPSHRFNNVEQWYTKTKKVFN